MPCFCSACLHLCLSVWLGRSYWQRALSLVKARQHLDRNQRKFSCLFCVGSGWRSDAPGPIRSRCSRYTVTRGSIKFIYMFRPSCSPYKCGHKAKKVGKKLLSGESGGGERNEKITDLSVLQFCSVCRVISFYVTAFFFFFIGMLLFFFFLLSLRVLRAVWLLLTFFTGDEKTKIHQVSLRDDSQMSLKWNDCSQTLCTLPPTIAGRWRRRRSISPPWQIADDTVGLSPYKSCQLLESDDKHLHVCVS